MVNEHAMHALLHCMEEANLLAIDVDDNTGVPAIGVLVIPEGEGGLRSGRLTGVNEPLRDSYLGAMVITLWPRLASSMGRPA